MGLMETTVVIDALVKASIVLGAAGLVATVGYTPFFVCLAFLDLVGAAVLWTVVRERKLEPAYAPLRSN